MKIKSFTVFSIILILFLSLSIVSANDLNDDLMTSTNDSVDLNRDSDSTNLNLDDSNENMDSENINLGSNEIKDANLDSNESEDANLDSNGSEDMDLDSNESESNIVKPNGNSFEDIQSAIDSAQDGDTIELDGIYTGNGSEVFINKSLNFQSSPLSNKAVLNGNNLSGIFLIGSGAERISLNNLNFIYGYYSSALLFEGNINCSIKNCIFEHNDEVAINFKSTADCYIESSIFKNNGWDVGAISFAKLDSNRLSIIDSNFSENFGMAIGAIDFYGSDSTIINCNFLYNDVREGDAAAYASHGNSTIINSTFKYNSATYDAGAILSNGNLFIENSSFEGNNAGYNGGAIFFSGNATIIKSNFTKNSVYYIGTAIHSIRPSKNKDSYLNLLNCSFNKNYFGSVDGSNSIISINGNVRNFSNSSFMLNNGFNKKTAIKITANNISAIYGKAKYFKMKFTFNDTKYEAHGLEVKVKVYSGKSYKTYNLIDDYDGCEFNIAYYSYYNKSEGTYEVKKSNLSPGTHKVEIIVKNPFTGKTVKKTAYIKINPIATTVKAPKVTYKYKKTNYFKITVKNKSNKKIIKGLKLKVKVYTGKKYKTYTVKTNSKGIAKLNTKSLKKGTHKVVISSGNNKFAVSYKSSIRIKR